MLVACPSCGCHARADEPRCPSCGASTEQRARTVDARLMGLLTIVFAAGCPSQVEGLGGAGGTDVAGNTSNTARAATNSIMSASTYGSGPTSSASSFRPGCDDLNDCEACAACAEETVCAPESSLCKLTPSCISLNDCINACPPDDPATPEDDQLMCICGVARGTCGSTSPFGTCVGDHPDGFQPLVALNNCIFNDTCQTSCDGP